MGRKGVDPLRQVQTDRGGALVGRIEIGAGNESVEITPVLPYQPSSQKM